LHDTIKTNEQDTIAVQLAAGIGDFCICLVSYDAVSLTVVDSVVTSLQDETSSPAYELYPNPFRGELTFYNTDQVVHDFILFDLNGKEIKRVETKESASYDLSDLNSGIYFYHIRSKTGRDRNAVGKLIKL